MSLTTFDPYTVLGIPRDANQRQVRQAYRRLAKRHHPDLNPDSDAIEQMRRVNQAWETLSTPGLRARYDADTARQTAGSTGHWSAAPRYGSATGPPAQRWSSAGVSQPRPYAYPKPSEEDWPGWLAVVVTVVIALAAFAALFAGIVPFPLFGVAVLVLVRSIFARVD